MVKITSSVIDIYTVPNTAPLQRRKFFIEQESSSNNTTMLPRKEYRRFSVDASDLLSDESSDSETSFFDDSDDNDEVTAFFGKHTNNYKNLRNGDCNQNITNFIEKPQGQEPMANNGRIKNIKNFHASCDILVSPRINRKNLKSSKTTSSLQQAATEDIIMGNRPPLRNFSVPNLTNLTCLNKNTSEQENSKQRVLSPTEEECHYKNSYLLSPRMRRKQIDITKSAAYKEIYAHNLRLYSSVLAKQVASTGQVGREMNEIRRNKLKKRALSTETGQNKNKLNRRSKSFAVNNTSAPACTDESKFANTRGRRSNSANSDVLSSQIQQSTMLNSCKDITEKSSSDGDLMTQEREDEERFRRRTQSLIPSKEILKRISSQTILDNFENKMAEQDDVTAADEQRNERSEAALRRKEQLQKKLESFDIMLDKTSNFLAKVKTIRKS